MSSWISEHQRSASVFSLGLQSTSFGRFPELLLWKRGVFLARYHALASR